MFKSFFAYGDVNASSENETNVLNGESDEQKDALSFLLL